MRSEKEVMDLILKVAREDERIRAVYMGGSRANPNVEKDIYQDYDIVYVVTETKSFLEDKNWISVFGDIAVMQGKYFKKYLPKELYEMYSKTYTDSNYNNFWAVVFNACELFRNTALIVGYHLGYPYNKIEDENMIDYLLKVKINYFVQEN
jgi:Streptomycin adenylyltransferase